MPFMQSFAAVFSHSAAFCTRQSIATRNIADFERFVPYGVKLVKVPTLS